MGQDAFDFDELKGQKYTEYKKVTCKVNKVKKAKGGLVVRKFDLSNKKKADLFIPFLKAKDAMLAYKALKKDKTIHKVKDTALVDVTCVKGEVTLDILQGGMDAVAITNGISQLFEDMTLNLTVTGMPSTDEDDSDTETEEVSDTSTAPDTETSTDEEGSKKEEREAKRAAKKAKRAAKLAKMLEGVAKLDSVKDKASKEKIEANIEKYQTVLDGMIVDAEADGDGDNKIDADEQIKIDELTNALNELKAAVAEGGVKKGKKLSKKDKEKITKNINTINGKLEAIMTKLGMKV